MTNTKSLDELRIWAKWLGRIFTVVAALMTFSFGYKLGGEETLACWLIGIGLSAVTVLVSILLNFADIAFGAGEKRIACAIIAFWAVAVGTEYFSHIGFTVGHRSSDVQNASMQTVAYNDARTTVDEDRAALKMWEERLSALAWVGTVTADGLRANLDAAQKAIDIEAAKGGCKIRCLERMRDKASIEEKIAAVEERAGLEKQMSATKKKLDAARAKAADTKAGSSAALTQQQMVAQLATLNLEPTKAALAWAGYGIGAFISLIFSFAATVCNFLGFREWGAKASALSVAAHTVQPARAVNTVTNTLKEILKPEIHMTDTKSLANAILAARA